MVSGPCYHRSEAARPWTLKLVVSCFTSACSVYLCVLCVKYAGNKVYAEVPGDTRRTRS